MEFNKKAPEGRTHEPVITIDYERKDAEAGDAKFLTLGKSTWNKEDFSAKIWRWAENGERWSRQSEELPLWRVLDLATLVVSTIYQKQSNLDEFVQNEQEKVALENYLDDNMRMLGPKLMELKRILSGEMTLPDKTVEPNIFSFATSELSQDAMFAWLIQWADCSYKNNELHNVAQDFLRLLMRKENSYVIEHVEVNRQWKNIDIWVEINENAFLIIEDKTGTSIHDDQLERYKKDVEEYYKGQRDDLCFAYVKTGNEPKSVLRAISQKGYTTISRKEIIECLSKYKGENALLYYFKEHLKKLENKTMSYKTQEVTKWEWSAWEGFYMELESHLDIDSWGYVPNPSGGFLGIWWHAVNFVDGNMYLQIEQGRLCFKIYYEGEEDKSDVRWKYHSKLMELAENKFPEIRKPYRFGAGTFMTIAIVEQDDLLGSSIVNMKRLVEKLKDYQKLVDTCCQDEAL